ncbi:NucA/NucB deoxyribonuclease domain-containing protein [Streptomyces sp. NPDC002537]
MGKRTTTRLRTAVAAAGAALLLPLGIGGVASAAPAPAGSGNGHRAIELGEPQQVRTVTKTDVTAAGDLGCQVGEAFHSRTQSCSYWKIPVVYTVDKVPEGTANLWARTTATLDPRNRYTWKQKVELRLTDPTTWAGFATTGMVGFDCGHCQVPASGERYLFPGNTVTYEFTASSPGRDLVNDSIRPYATLKAPRHDKGSAVIGSTFRPRCDNTPRITPQTTGGCVYPDVPALYQIDVTNPRVDAVGWHVLWAQRNLKHPWGVVNSRYPLHRTFDQKLQDDNRGVACGSDVPRPPGRPDLTCDEYPFAQTYEGASRNPDYSCHFLNGTANSREGSLRKSVLNGQRVLENDAFYVQVVNVPKKQLGEPGLMGPVGCGHD